MDILSKEHLPIFKQIGETADKLGLPCYVVGGYVRDRLLYFPFKKDIDFVCLGSGIELAKAVGKSYSPALKVNWFKNFGTANIKIDGIEIEFVGARKESYRKDSRKPIVEDGTLEDDQLRRDFTINALAVSVNKNSFGELIDPFNGITDIENQIIKTPTDPDKTFDDDPLRMLRAIRFASQLHFDIEENTFNSIIKNSNRISILSQERITDELNKIVLSPMPSIGFKLLDAAGLLEHIFPEMVKLKGVETINGKSHKDNFYHTLEVLDNTAKVSNDLWLRWAAILHDIAKPVTKRFEEGHGFTFHGHEAVGAKWTPKIFKKLKLPLDAKMKFVQKLVALHLRPIVLAKDEVSDSAIRRLLFDAGDDIDSLMKLCTADITTKNEYKQKKYQRNFELVRQKLKDVEEKDQVRNFQPPITGEMIMETFSIAPSRPVGDIKNAIKEAILEGEIKNDYQEAFDYMLALGIKMGLKPTNSNPNN